jgi:hypothetical protein
MRRILCLILSLSMLVGWSTPDSTIKMGPSSTGDRSIIAEQGAGASNPKIKYDSASSVWQFSNDGTSFKNFGSGSGQSNAFLFNDFEDNSVENWATYADAAAATPVDGTGGTATTLTVTASSSSPLNGTFSMSLAKSAANGQGQGVAAEFAIPSGYQQGAKRSLEFLWDGSGANYVAGDMRVYIYDVTNSTLITPQPYTELPAAKTPIQLSWDASSSASYRLIFHVATTNANAYTVKIDDVDVGPGQVIPMPASHTPIDFNWTLQTVGASPPGALGTYSVKKGWYTRNPDGTADIYYEYAQSTAGTAGQAGYTYSLSMPPGLTIDTTRVTSGTNGRSALSGSATFSLGTGSIGSGIPVVFNSEISAVINGSLFWRPGENWNFGAADLRFAIHVTGVPIVEWQDSPNYVASASQAVVSTKANMTANQTGINPNNSGVQLVYNNVLENVGGGVWDSGGFVVPHSGTYLVHGAQLFAGTNVLANTYRLQVRRGPSFAGSSVVGELDWHVPDAGAFFGVYGSTVVRANKGDRLYMQLFGAGNNSSNTLETSAATSAQYSMIVNRLTDEYGRPVVGFGYVTQDSAGLVKRAGQLLATNTNDDAAAGYVGEEYSVPTWSTSSDTAVAGTAITVATLSNVPAGDWILFVNVAALITRVSGTPMIEVHVYDGATVVARQLASSSATAVVPISIVAPVKSASTKNYTLRILCNANADAGAGKVYGSNANISGALYSPGVFKFKRAR